MSGDAVPASGVHVGEAAGGGADLGVCLLDQTATSDAETRPRQKYAKLSYAGRRTESVALLALEAPPVLCMTRGVGREVQNRRSTN